MPWREAAGSLTGGGLTAAFDLPTQGVVVMAQAKDERWPTRPAPRWSIWPRPPQ